MFWHVQFVPVVLDGSRYRQRWPIVDVDSVSSSLLWAKKISTYRLSVDATKSVSSKGVPPLIGPPSYHVKLSLNMTKCVASFGRNYRNRSILTYVHDSGNAHITSLRGLRHLHLRMSTARMLLTMAGTSKSIVSSLQTANVSDSPSHTSGLAS